MKYMVTEYWPGCVERRDEPKVDTVEGIMGIANLGWIKPEWAILGADGLVIDKDGWVRATFVPCV